MAPLPVIDGIHRVAFSWRYGGGGTVAVNVMHFKGASSDPVGLNAALNANVTTTMWFGMDTSTACYQLSITPLDAAGSATQVFAESGSKWQGNNTVGQWTPAVATVVSLRTILRGRQNRGRIYLPFQQEQTTNAGVNSSVTACQTAWDAFRTAMNTSLFPLHVASYGHGMHRHKNTDGSYTITPTTWAPHSTAVSSVLVESANGTQRRRMSRLR